MATVRVEPNRTILKWAIDRCDYASSRFPKLEEWIAGQSAPTLRQLEDFAKTTAVPFGYFFLDEPPVDHLPIPLFRSVPHDDIEPLDTELREMIRSLMRRQEWMREQMIDDGYAPLPFVATASVRDDPAEVAARIRHTLKLDAEWAAQERTWRHAKDRLINKAENAGICVSISGIVGNNTQRPLPVELFRGFVLVDQYAPMIFINAADWKAAQMFTMAHEIAHVWLGSSAAFDLREMRPAPDPTEQACDRIAAELLVPREALGEFRRRNGPRCDFQKIASHFKVSEIVAARRCLDLGLIGEDQFREFYKDYSQRFKDRSADKSGGGDFFALQQRRLGSRFSAAVVRAVHEGRILHREAYRLTGLYGKTFDEYAKTL